MAIMRTNRLTSKTTTPPSKGRKMIPASELEAQDAAYKKYKEQDLPNYEKRMARYNEESKSGRSYADWGGRKNVRPLDKAELSAYNKSSLENDPTALEYRNVEVGKSYSGKLGDKDWMIGARHMTSGAIKPTIPQKREKADWSNVQLDKMATKTPTSIKTQKGKLRDMKVEEFGQFEAPSAVTTKTKTKAAMTGGGNKLVRAKNPSGSLGAARVTTEKKKAAPGYNRERKQFEAFAKPLPTGGSLNVMEDTSPVIKRAQAEASQLKSAYRKEGNREGVKMMGAEAKQLGRAAKFADKMYEKGGGDYFTRDMVKGFRGSDANPANQNTIQRQEQLLNKRK